jgi:hypothetical protein
MVKIGLKSSKFRGKTGFWGVTEARFVHLMGLSYSSATSKEDPDNGKLYPRKSL